MANQLFSSSFPLNLDISYTGNDGAFTNVASIPFTTGYCSKINIHLDFGFRFVYSVGNMEMDVRFTLETGSIITRVPTGSSFAEAVLDIGYPGSHILKIEMRSVLLGGPPVKVTASGKDGVSDAVVTISEAISN
jgi:hypothetical protein